VTLLVVDASTLLSATVAKRDSPLAVLLDAVTSGAMHLPDPVSPPKILRDSDDDYLVALALAANATAIVTGDRDLLDHENLKPPALSARQACEMLGLPAS
jgi:hypothetical protein